MTAPDGQAPCGPNADDRYCARYWEMSAEVDRLRGQIQAVRKICKAAMRPRQHTDLPTDQGVMGRDILDQLDAEP